MAAPFEMQRKTEQSKGEDASHGRMPKGKAGRGREKSKGFDTSTGKSESLRESTGKHKFRQKDQKNVSLEESTGKCKTFKRAQGNAHISRKAQGPEEDGTIKTFPCKKAVEILPSP